MKKTLKKIIAVMLSVMLCLSLAPFAFAEEGERTVVLRGDANCDGKVNSSDALLVLQYSVGSIDEINTYWGDLNGDGQLNSTDALRILQISVKSDNPLNYGTEEILKFYSDALSMSCQNPSEIQYSTYYNSIMVNDKDATDCVEFNEEYEMTETYVNGYDEYGYSAYDFCPSTWIDMEFVDSAEIELTEGGYYVTITLKEEWAYYDDPVPYATYWYTANYADCTNSGLDTLFAYDGSACFYQTEITAYISEEGFVTELILDIPFEMYMSLEDIDGYHYADVTETGMICDSYSFVF